MSEYKENNFTPIIKDIINKYKNNKTLSEKQKMLLIIHLVYTDI
jgi:hypothetical protein